MRTSLIAAMVLALCAAPASLAQSFPAESFQAAAGENFVWSPPDGAKLEFDVFRNGEKFGRHVVTFDREGDALNVATDIELKVALGPLTLFHYVHQAKERYEAGRLAALSARTKNEGKWTQLAAEATAGGLKIAGAGFKGVQAGEAIPSLHWNVRQMQQDEMLSSETGAMLPMEVIDQGIERVKVGAREIEARRYLVKSEMEATFWYDAAGRWVKCAFSSKGSNVEYVLRELPA